MAIIPYPQHAATSAVAARVVRQRSGELPNLFRMLLHSPNLAEGWLALGTAVRQRCSLDPRARELAICYVAASLNCVYEWHHHAPLAVEHGITVEQLDDVRRWRERDDLEPPDRAVLEYAEFVLSGQGDRERALASVLSHCDVQATVELTATVAYYVAVARLVASLGLDLDD